MTLTYEEADAVPPVLSGVPADVTVPCDAVPDPATVTATDDVDGTAVVSFTEDRTNGACANEYTLTRTWSATDAAGNTATASQTITVVDNTPPTIAGVPTEVFTINTDPTDAVACGVAVTFPAITATDNCEGDVTLAYDVGSVTVNSRDVFDVGLTTVNVTATDVCGNTATSSFDIQVVDAEAPVPLEIPADITVQCASEVPAPELKARDNCLGEFTLSSAKETFIYTNNDNDFKILRTYILRDNADNLAEVSHTITVKDTEAPLINQISPVNVNTDPGQCSASLEFTTTVSDNCDVGINPVFSVGETEISFPYDFPVGTTTVFVDAEDAAGNAATQSSFTVTVNDAEMPVFVDVPTNITVAADPDQCSAEIADLGIPTATDNCSVKIISDAPTDGIFPIGTTIVTWTAIDPATNAITVTQEVRVEDQQAPVFSSFPDDITVANEADICGAAVTFTLPEGVDNCAVASLIQTDATGLSSGSTFPVGTTTLSYTLTDNAGNSISRDLNITVEDQQAPVFSSFPDDITVANEAGICEAAVTFTLPEGVDNCAVASLIQTDATGLSSGSSFPVGTTTLSYTLTDGAGNAVSRNLNITVNDTEVPFVDLPGNISVSNDAGQCGAIVNFSVSAIDNCDGAVNPVLSQASGTFFPVGTTTVTVDATDAAGNATTQSSFTVTVTDNEFPAVMTRNLTVQLDVDGQASITTTDIDNGSTDNCEIKQLTLSKTNFDCSNVGQNTVTLNVLDIYGNTNFATAVVTVEDIVPPTAVAQNITVQLDVNGNASITAADIDGGSTDNCAIASTSIDVSSFSCANLGVNTVVLTVTDVNGNTSTANATVTVVDNQAPTVLTQNITVELDANGQASITPQDVDNGSSDNCSFDLSLDVSSFGCANLGDNTVTLTATDASGNTSSSMATVTVVDNLAPSITAPANITVANDPGLCGAVVALGTPLTSDNCTVQLPTNDAPSTFPVGTTWVEWTVTDQSGNSSTAMQSVTVTNAAPVITAITAPTDPVAISNTVTASVDYADNNISTAVFDWGDGSTTDAGSAVGPTGTLTSSHQYSIPGVYTLTVTLTDQCGEMVSSIFQYIVIYDPSGGFVTGGGWINSPVGASVEYPDAVGKANFGFVSKYKKGANVPTGNTQFQFKAGDLKFKSTSYEWLVVAGDRAKYKGEGIINGGGSYGFMLTATDNDAGDLFRIKIWDKMNGDALVYDNQMGASDDSYAGTALGGGSIVVHDGKGGKNKRNVDNSKIVAQSSPDIFGETPNSYSFSYQAYPNPVLNQLRLEISSEEDEEVNFRVYDVVGRVLHESRHSLYQGDNQIELNTSDWEVAQGKLMFQLQSPSQGVHWLPLLKK